jgi:hypothetical protein
MLMWHIVDAHVFLWLQVYLACVWRKQRLGIAYYASDNCSLWILEVQEDDGFSTVAQRTWF